MRPRSTIFEKYYEEEELDDEAILEEEISDEDRVSSEEFNCPKCGKNVN
jgi:predicted RNA-binding Zn-ribbon protein involved in translation (DUF1610 family)